MSDNDKQKVWVVITYDGEVLGVYANHAKALDHKESAESYNSSLEIYVDEYEVIK